MTTLRLKNVLGTCVALGVLAVGAVLALPQFAHAQSTIPLCEIERSLTVGMTGEDVRCLQRYLNWSGFVVASSGVGSPGNETAYYGSLTANALARWQNAYAAQVLAPAGLTAGTGYWGPLSFAHYVRLVHIALGVTIP